MPLSWKVFLLEHWKGVVYAIDAAPPLKIKENNEVCLIGHKSIEVMFVIFVDHEIIIFLVKLKKL